MFDQLERVREKPRAQRQALALGIAATITGMVFILWVVSFLASIQPTQDEHGQRGAPSSDENAFGIDSFTNSFQEISTFIQEGVDTTREQFEAVNTELQRLEEGENSFTSTPPVTAGEVEGVPVVEEEVEVRVENEITPSGIEIIQVEE